MVYGCFGISRGAAWAWPMVAIAADVSEMPISVTANRDSLNAGRGNDSDNCRSESEYRGNESENRGSDSENRGSDSDNRRSESEYRGNESENRGSEGEAFARNRSMIRSRRNVKTRRQPAAPALLPIQFTCCSQLHREQQRRVI